MPKGYCEINDIEDYLLTEIDGSFEPQIESWIEAMENYIDKTTGRNFIADDQASVKKYDGDGDYRLFIDDAVDISKIEIDGNEVAEYFLYPANDFPITKIELEDDYFTRGHQNVEVEGKWGYSVDVPADITLACAILVAGVINQSLSQEGEVQSETVGPYSVTYKSEQNWRDFFNIKNTLLQYRRYNNVV